MIRTRVFCKLVPLPKSSLRLPNDKSFGSSSASSPSKNSLLRSQKLTFKNTFRIKPIALTDNIGEEKIELANFYRDVIWLDAKTAVLPASFVFREPLAVRRFERNSAKEDDHHQIEAPDLKITI